MKSTGLWGLMAVLVLWSSPLGAQNLEAPGAAAPLPLVTDRPDFTESSATVPAGHAQFEFGL